MSSGSESSFRTRSDARVEHTKYERDEQERPDAPAMVDAVDQLDRHPQRSGIDEQPDKEDHPVEYYRRVIAQLFHAWERRLHAASKDRVVRPFEWGLDWIEANEHVEGSPPERVLLDWAAHAVSDSTRFFETPETSDYTFRSGVEGASGAVSFPSAMHTRYPENNTVHALYFEAKPVPKRSRARGGHSRAEARARAKAGRFWCFRNGMPVLTVTSASAGR